jgi:hypothetical protein
MTPPLHPPSRPPPPPPPLQPAADHRVAAPEASMGPCFDSLTPDALVQVLLRLGAR